MLNSLHFATRFIDIVADMHLTAAFDATYHSILLSHHSTSFGFTYTWLQSYLIGLYQSVHAGRHSSTPTLSTFAVSQRSVLWPLLFIFTSLASNIVNNHSIFSTVTTLTTPCRSTYLFLPPAILLIYQISLTVSPLMILS